MEPQGKSKRPLYLPPRSVSPNLLRKSKAGEEKRNQKGIPDEKMNQMLPANKSFTALMNDPKEQRRNGICVMLMPAEYFAALPHLELLNVRYEFGLEKFGTALLGEERRPD